MASPASVRQREPSGASGRSTAYRHRRWDSRRNFASYDLAEKVLGYRPTISREDGIRRTWDWFQENVFTH